MACRLRCRAGAPHADQATAESGRNRARQHRDQAAGGRVGHGAAAVHRLGAAPRVEGFDRSIGTASPGGVPHRASRYWRAARREWRPAALRRADAGALRDVATRVRDDCGPWLGSRQGSCTFPSAAGEAGRTTRNARPPIQMRPRIAQFLVHEPPWRVDVVQHAPSGTISLDRHPAKRGFGRVAEISGRADLPLSDPRAWPRPPRPCAKRALGRAVCGRSATVHSSASHR